MIPTQPEIKAKIFHIGAVLKLMQTFVTKKFLLFMGASWGKWLLLILFQVNPASALFLSHASAVDLPKKSFHPFYVSVTEFNYNQKDKVLEISCKLFAEDLENALKTLNKINIDIIHPKDPKLLEKYIFEYLAKHLQLKINGKAVTLQYVGYEKEQEAVWGYLQVNNVPPVKRLEVMNNILYESYTTQISIMHASVGSSRKSTKLVYPDKEASFEF